MRRLSYIVLGILFSLSVFAQKSPHGKQLKIDCSECHTTGNWLVNSLTSTFNHNQTGFSLLGEHTELDCKLCHLSLNFSDEKGKIDCASCHLDVHQQTLGNDCEACHSSQSWIINDVKQIHFNSRFPLVGAHANADCFDCHLSENLLQFRPLGVECIDCHRIEYQATTSPNHLQSGYSTDCLDCHNMLTIDWASGFEHDFFPLTDGHDVDCFACHTSQIYGSLSTDCESCHLADYNVSVDPPHASLNFSVNCLDCHTTLPGWSPATFDIHNDFYILEGAHAMLASDCAECHSNGYINTPNTCYACHTEEFTGADDPAHISNNFPVDCTECHSQNVWDPSTFNHNEYYALEGAHATIANECMECHTDGYVNTPNTCYACHTEEYTSTDAPPHVVSDFSTDCLECHSQNAWSPATFDHNSIYVLEGAHATFANDCIECHANGYVDTPNTCYACHTEEYTSTNDPPHAASNFSTECLECHSQSTWSPSTFDHNSIYVLEGAHAIIANNCLDCHASGYINTPNTCYECHLVDYNGANDPPHLASNFPVDCTECHSQNAWSPSTFDHNSIYVLEGAHATFANDCIECHANGYVDTPNTCYACHTEEYASTIDPSHVNLNFSTDCTECHSQSVWIPSTFDHNSIYILEGAHATIANDCIECHANGYVNTPNTCYACHTEEYTSTNDPPHAASNFSTECLECHSQNAWSPATFDHSSIYVLEGAHAIIANNCLECHASGYINTPNTCYECHLADYNSANDPPHLASNFPVNCTECHSQNAWEPSTFDHDALYFSIYSGKHQGEWNSCIDCHTVTSNYAVFSCIDCHEHNKTDMDDEHSDVSAYVYASINCFDCHPIGKAD